MYTLLVTGDTPGASSYFNPLVQQSIIPVTSGTRPSPSHEGMTIYETDTNAYAKWTGSAWEYVGGSRTATFQPALSSDGTAPSLGTGPGRFGSWCYLPGGSVQFTFFVRFGTSPTAGTGNYYLSLPVAAVAPFGTSNSAAIGSILIADASSGGFRSGACYVPGNNLGLIGLTADAGAIVGAGSPWAWAVNDYISGSIIYPV